MKPTVVSSTSIPGWDCKLEQITDDQAAYVCSPSDALIREVAGLRWSAQGGHPTTEAEAVRIWLEAEDDLLVNWEDFLVRSTHEP
jgi:hypothetical protein